MFFSLRFLSISTLSPSLGKAMLSCPPILPGPACCLPEGKGPLRPGHDRGTPPRRWRSSLHDGSVRERDRMASQAVHKPLGDDVGCSSSHTGRMAIKLSPAKRAGMSPLRTAALRISAKILQEAVPDCVAVRIVDDLEIIDVYVQEGKLVLLAHGPLGLILEQVPEGDLVVQAGQGSRVVKLSASFAYLVSDLIRTIVLHGREW